MPLALRYGGIPEGSWCRRCPVGTWAQRDECHKALGNGPPLRTVVRIPSRSSYLSLPPLISTTKAPSGPRSRLSANGAGGSGH